MSKKRKKGRQRRRQQSSLRPGKERPEPTVPGEDDEEEIWDGDGVESDEWDDVEGTEAGVEQAQGRGSGRGERRPAPLRPAGRAVGGRAGRNGQAGRTLRRRTLLPGRRPARRPSPAKARGRGPQEPQPPILAPIARSFVLVGTSPLILGTAFLSVLVIWLIYSSSGIIRIASPATMAQIQSLVPLHSLLDLQFMFAELRVFSAPVAIGLSAVLLLLRAAFLSLILALIAGALDPEARTDTWQEELRVAGRRAYSVFQFVFAIEAGMVVAVYAMSSILGSFFGVLGLVLALIFEMYLLVLSPVVAATERLGAAASVRLSIRAARLRGPQQLTLAFVYVFAALYVVLGLRGSAAAPATPSIAVWAYVLFATFINVSLLTALTYRWLLVRGIVGADDERARVPRSRRAPTR